MKIFKGLIIAAATLMLSSVASATPTAAASFENVEMVATQMRGPFDEQQFCREEPDQCYCTYIGGRKYCFIL